MTKKELMNAVDTIKAANAVLWKAAQPLIHAYEKWGPFGSDEQAEHSYNGRGHSSRKIRSKAAGNA